MPGRAFSRRRRIARVLGCFGSQAFMSGGPVWETLEQVKFEELRQHPLPLVPERVIDGVIQTDGFHQAHRQRAMIFPFRRHIFRPSVKLL